MRWMMALAAFSLGIQGCNDDASDPKPVPERSTKSRQPVTPDKVGECKAMVSIINESVELIMRRTARDAGANDLPLLVSDMEDAAKRMSTLKLGDAKLKAYARRYLSMAREIGSAAKTLHQSVENVDRDMMLKAQTRLDKAVKLEAPLVDEINQYCKS